MTLVSRAVAFLAGALLLGACAIQPDSMPHDISPDDQERLRVTQTDAEIVGALESDRVYLVVPGNPSRLRAVLRESSGTVRGRIESLLGGPTSDDRDRNLTTALPADLTLNRVTVSATGDIVTVDVGDQLLGLPDSELRLAIAQIVHTASQLQPSVQVVVKVDDVAQAWPVGNGTFQRGGLTIYDFYGVVESAQPAYPQPVPRSPIAATAPNTEVIEVIEVTETTQPAG